MDIKLLMMTMMMIIFIAWHYICPWLLFI